VGRASVRPAFFFGVRMFVDKVTVQGYQSLYDVEVKLGNFTVIYGASDVGKSAFYRAFRAVVTCESGDSFISKGKSKTHIVFTMGTGESIHFVKRKGKSGEYACVDADNPDGQVWKRNRNLPIELSKRLRFGSIIVEGEKAYPNFRGQHDPMFLMFESSGRKARMLGSLISNILLQGIRDANSERNRNQADARALLELISDLEKQKDFDWDSFLSLVSTEKKIIMRLKDAKDLYDSIQKLVQERTKLEELSDFEVEFIPQSDLTTLSLYLDALEKFTGLVAEREKHQIFYNNGEGIRKEWVEAEKEMSKRIDEFKAQLMFECPECGHKISRLEIENA
jgi:energy-coupling factor transporter ATP-binding protein EcfA2